MTTQGHYKNCLTNIGTIVWIPQLEQSTFTATDQHWHDWRAQDSQGVDVITLRVGTIHSLGGRGGPQEERERTHSNVTVVYNIIS